MKHSISPSNSLTSPIEDTETQNKLNQEKQLKTILSRLKDGVFTTTQLSASTGINKSAICRYKSDLQQHGLLKIVHRSKDPVTGFPADHYTLIEKGGSHE